MVSEKAKKLPETASFVPTNWSGLIPSKSRVLNPYLKGVEIDTFKIRTEVIMRFRYGSILNPSNLKGLE